MNGGDAAEQTVRLAMEGAEFTLKIAGEGAERILALLAAALKPSPGKESAQKRRGRERLKSLLKPGADTKFFEIQEKDLEKFAAAAKQYNIKYCVLRPKDNEGGMVEIVARAENAARISHIMERLQARDLGSSTREQTKSAKEVKTEQKATEKAAKEKRDAAVRDARNESRQAFQGKRAELQTQYLRDIGKVKSTRERRQPRTRTGQLLQELTTEIARHIPVVGALVRRREEAAAPAVPEHETPAQDVADSLLAQPAAKEGKAQQEAPAAVQRRNIAPEEPTAHPPTRTERTRKDPPSAPSSQTRQNGGGIISEPERKPSVKDDIAAEIARRGKQKQPASPRQQSKGQKPKQPQRKKSKAKEK